MLRPVCILILLLSTGRIASAEEAILSGSAVSELGTGLPVPPAGFRSAAEVLARFQAGTIPLVDIKIAVPETIEVRRNVEYGRNGDRPLLLDLYLPRELSHPAPALVFIHGGAWKGGSKEDYHYYGVRFAEKGYVVASIRYRLSQEAIYPAAVHDTKCAVRFLRAGAASLRINPDRIAAVGGSAGGHLAMMVGYAEAPELEGEGGHAGVSSRVQAVVELYGPCDLTTDFVRQNPFANVVVRDFLGATIDADLPRYQAASPITHLDAGDPPTLILHGTMDDIVPVDQGDRLAARLKELKIPYVYARLPGWPHAMDLSQSVNDYSVDLMSRFLERFVPFAEP